MKGNVTKYTAVAIMAMVGLVFMQPAAAFASHQDYRYVALGDSVSAGLGLSAEDALCGRSTEAYPQHIADYYNISVENISCSGAKTDEGIYDAQQRNGTEIAPQLETAFANGTPDLITITIGANDLRWTQFINDCYTWKCGSGWDNVRAKAYLAGLKLELAWMFHQIHRMSGGDPPLVALSGYYHPFAYPNCEDTRNVTQNEAAWINGKVDKLNAVIESSAARYYFAKYVPVDFSGHELCSSNPWLQGLNDPAPFHPTAEGQRAIASAFTRTLSP